MPFEWRVSGGGQTRLKGRDRGRQPNGGLLSFSARTGQAADGPVQAESQLPFNGGFVVVAILAERPKQAVGPIRASSAAALAGRSITQLERLSGRFQMEIGRPWPLAKQMSSAACQPSKVMSASALSGSSDSEITE
jgi:hypothetical protein